MSPKTGTIQALDKAAESSVLPDTTAMPMRISTPTAHATAAVRLLRPSNLGRACRFSDFSQGSRHFMDSEA